MNKATQKSKLDGIFLICIPEKSRKKIFCRKKNGKKTRKKGKRGVVFPFLFPEKTDFEIFFQLVKRGVVFPEKKKFFLKTENGKAPYLN